MLERDGHEVVVAENGREAVRLVRASDFDLVFMDVHMPVMDGIEATRLIRKFPPPKCDMPIIALTANVMAPEQQKCREAGMNDVLMKPVDWDRVRSCPGRGPPDDPADPPTPVRRGDLRQGGRSHAAGRARHSRRLARGGG